MERIGIFIIGMFLYGLPGILFTLAMVITAKSNHDFDFGIIGILSLLAMFFGFWFIIDSFSINEQKPKGITSEQIEEDS